MRNDFWLIFGVIFGGVIVVDQAIKWAILLYGYTEGDVIFDALPISLVLAFNKGVAFSMFAFLAEYLKYLQLALLVAIFAYLWRHRELLSAHVVALGAILGAGVSNVLDRFMHGGVVDYVFWHWGFEFAIFNFADVVINLGVALFILQMVLRDFKQKQRKKG